jgi:glycine oxidase
MTVTSAGVVVAGGGVIGMAIAWQAAAAGFDVAVVDPDCGDAASLVAAGMLAPVSESLFGEDALLRLNLLAVSRFGAFAAALEEATGCDVGLRREGTLAVAYDASDYAALVRLTEFRRSVGLTAQELDGRACRGLEPFLAPDVRGGFLFGGDWSVDNRRYVAALGQAARDAGVRMVRGRVAGLLGEEGGRCAHRPPPVAVDGTSDHLGSGGPVSGVRLAGGDVIGCDVAVIAAGHASGGIEGLPEALRSAVRPVKGQLLRLRHPAGIPPVLSRTVRATVRGMDVYLVPRADGEVVVGATSEERGPDRTVTAGAVHDLLHDAMTVLPVTSELVLAEACAGLRPGTADNGPIVGATGLAGVLLATGHYRNGILLSAVTADAILAQLTGQPAAAEWEPFWPRRFMAAVTS